MAAEGMFIAQVKKISVVFSKNVGIMQSLFLVGNRMFSWLSYIVLPLVAEKYGWKSTFHLCFAVCVFCLLTNIIFLFLSKMASKWECAKYPEEQETQKILSSRNYDSPSYSSGEDSIPLSPEKANEQQMEPPKEGIFVGIRFCFRSFPLCCILVMVCSQKFFFWELFFA